MTRTERAAFPRALMRDRSESKSGLDKSIRKGGNGGHNWGDPIATGYRVFEDEEQSPTAGDERRESLDKPTFERRSNSFTEEEKRSARDFRKTAFKGQAIDLSAIARTSAAASSSPTTRNAVPMV